jgi:thymidylate kinase
MKNIFKGKLFTFEGIDGVGKTTLASAFYEHLKGMGIDCVFLAFPGSEEGTLGKHVYKIHHDPVSVGINSLSPTSKQILHIAAHIEAIETKILPALKCGKCVILDRFWWSTWVYGMVGGANKNALQGLIDLELLMWNTVRPSAAFLIRRKISIRESTHKIQPRLENKYLKLALIEKNKYPVFVIDNEGSIGESLSLILSHVDPMFEWRKATLPKRSSAPGAQYKLPVGNAGEAKTEETKQLLVFSKLAPVKPTIVFDTFWRFAAERQAIFFLRAQGAPPPWTSDHVLKEYKFTNAYRASDRVSQYLIKRVIYEGNQTPVEVFFRILLFKMFNRIATWELLLHTLGAVSYAEFSFKKYDSILSSAIDSGERIYSAAYIMPSGGPGSSFGRKHRMHLSLIDRMIKEELPLRIVDAPSMSKAFDMLLSYPTIGDFLAYQYVTDLNYSNLTNFTEMEFVVAGPGALDGIQKCFSNLGGLNESEVIKLVADWQEEEFNRLGLKFQSLWGRRLQLIDCQNLFCEVSKYSRIAHPEYSGITGRTRIKQKFRMTPESVDYWYPPKWGLNHLMKRGGDHVSHI